MLLETLTSKDQIERENRARGALGTFGRNTLWLWVDRGGLRIGTMVSGLFLVRYLGPTDLGIYSITLATGAFVNGILDLGLTRYAARIVATVSAEGRPILALSLAVTLVSAAAETVLLVMFAQQGNNYAACMCAGLIVGNVEGTNALCSFMLTADLRSRAILPGSLLGVSWLIALTVVVIKWRLSLFILLIGLIVRSLVVLVARLSQLCKFYPTRQEWHIEELRRVVIEAWPFFSYSLAGLAYGSTSILCLSLVASRANVGYLAAAIAISAVLPELAFASQDALLPVMTRFHEAGYIVEVQLLQQRLLNAFFLVTLPIVVLLSIFAPEICSLVGSRFAPAAPVLRIIAFRSMLSILEGLGGIFLIATGLVSIRRAMLVYATVTLGLLTLSLGYLWGAQGAAFAAVVAQGLLLTGYVRALFRAGYHLSAGRAVWGSLASAVAMTIIIMPRDPTHALTLLYGLPIALAIYLAVLILIARKALLESCCTIRSCFS
jgi:O-antigen/teichoic acid export membrane protein